MVEFAITLVFYFLILLLVISMAVTMFNQGTINAAGRLAVRQGSLYWRDPANDGDPGIKNAVIDTAVEFYINKILLSSDPDADLTCTPDSDYLACTVPGANLTGGIWETTPPRDILDSKAVVKVTYPNTFLFNLNSLIGCGLDMMCRLGVGCNLLRS
jgi:hypothetical protein